MRDECHEGGHAVLSGDISLEEAEVTSWLLDSHRGEQ